MINRGGVKVAPEEVDQLLQSWPGLADGAAFAFEDGSGNVELAMALVAPETLDLKALYAALLTTLGPAHTPRYHVLVELIPRNELGKVRRAELAAHMLRMLREQRAAAPH